MSVDQNVEDNADCESPACAFDRENSCHNTGESALGICVDHAESDLAADKALHDKSQRQSCRKDRLYEGCNRNKGNTDKGGPTEGTDSAENGIHCFSAILVTFGYSSSNGCPERTAKARIRADKRLNDVSDRADDVGTVRVEVDVLIGTDFLSAADQLLTGNEIAECDDINSDGCRNRGDDLSDARETDRERA